MRNEFVTFLCEKIKSMDDVDKSVFITGDLGYSVVEPLKEILKERFINVGVAEAQMMSIAAAFAADGMRVFTYSITPFATFRCLEQIRNDICYHNLNVTIVGIGAGYGYGTLGPTHHSTEDLAALWALPNLNVYSPGDLTEANACYEDSWQQPGPKYLRLSKGGDKALCNIDINLTKKPIVIHRNGDDLSIICTGNILADVLSAVEHFSKHKIQVISCPKLKPFPSHDLVNAITSNKILVIEELSGFGGLSGQIAKTILQAENKRGCVFQSLSTKDQFADLVGDLNFQREQSGLGRENILNAITELLLRN